MTGVFDGLGNVFGGVFGGTVTHTPPGGQAVPIEGAIFRESPRFDDLGGGGFSAPVLSPEPSLRIPKDLASAVEKGSLIAPGNGKTYRVLSIEPPDSPAPDALLTILIEETTP